MARRVGEGKDSVQDMVKNPPKTEEVIMALLKVAKQPSKPLLKKATGDPATKPRELDPVVLEAPRNDEGIQVEIRADSKDLINGKA